MGFSPVLLVSGADAYRRRKRLGRLLQGLQSQGWRVSEVEATDSLRLSQLLTGSSLFRAKTLILVNNPDKINAELVVRQQNSPAQNVVLLLHQDGEAKGAFKALLKRIPDSAQQYFPKPTLWKQDEDAISLCQVEMRERGKTISKELSEQIVGFVGSSDLGFLAFEMFKLSVLLDAYEEKEVKPSHVASTVTLLEEASVFPILDALGTGNLRKLQAALGRVEKTTSGDPTIKVVRMLAPTLGKWAAAVALDEKKVPPDEAAILMNHNAWYHQNKVLPPARRWGSRRLLALLGSLAEAERQVFQGTISPWIGLESRMVRACSQLRK